MKGQEKVLMYQIPAHQPRGKQIREILERLGMPYGDISTAMLSQTVGYLAGLAGFSRSTESYSGPEFTDEFLLMSQLSRARMDALLTGMKEAGVAPVQLKAVVTEHNQHWRLDALLREITREHEVMKVYGKLAKLIDETAGTLTPVSPIALRVALQKSQEAIQRAEPDPQELRQCLAMLDSVTRGA